MMKAMIAAAIALLTGTAAVSDINRDTQIPGGWDKTEETAVTPQMQEIFKEATDRLIGADYEAAGLIGTQIVNGINYMFRAEMTAMYPGAVKENVIVTVYKDPAGNVQVINIENAD